MAEADDKALVAQILSSYLSNNSVSPADLPGLFSSQYSPLISRMQLRSRAARQRAFLMVS
jgi:predicted transcriptional regulator